MLEKALAAFPPHEMRVEFYHKFAVRLRLSIRLSLDSLSRASIEFASRNYVALCI